MQCLLSLALTLRPLLLLFLTVLAVVIYSDFHVEQKQGTKSERDVATRALNAVTRELRRRLYGDNWPSAERRLLIISMALYLIVTCTADVATTITDDISIQ